MLGEKKDLEVTGQAACLLLMRSRADRKGRELFAEELVLWSEASSPTLCGWGGGLLKGGPSNLTQYPKYQ